MDGLLFGTESGDFIEIIAWAEAQGPRPWRLVNGFLEDVPVVPRAYRILSNLPARRPIGVVAATAAVFTTDADRISTVPLPFGAAKLTINTFEISIPELEKRETVLRQRKALKATTDGPLYFFLLLGNGGVTRFYPFRVDREN